MEAPWRGPGLPFLGREYWSDSVSLAELPYLSCRTYNRTACPLTIRTRRASQPEIAGHSMFHLGELVAIKVVHGLTVNVSDVDAANLVDQ